LYRDGDVRLLPSLARMVQWLGDTGQPEGAALTREVDALFERAGERYDGERLGVFRARLRRANRVGDFKASEAAAAGILAVQERRHGQQSPEYGAGLSALAWAYVWQNRYEESEAMYRRALSLIPPNRDQINEFGSATE